RRRIHRMLTAGVLGAGLMGDGIAGVLARGGYAVRIHDIDGGALETAVRRLQAEGLTVEAAYGIEGLARDADLVVEAGAGNLKLKRALFVEPDRFNPGGGLARNRSGLRVTAIAAGGRDAGRVVGTHWWNPPQLIPVVEVVRGEK